jgi:hypothetical protein
MGGDHKALIMISHPDIDRREMVNVLCRRWPDVVLKDLEQEEPTWAWRLMKLPHSAVAAEGLSRYSLPSCRSGSSG